MGLKSEVFVFRRKPFLKHQKFLHYISTWGCPRSRFNRARGRAVRSYCLRWRCGSTAAITHPEGANNIGNLLFLLSKT
jgi:hypothetical protein